MLLLIEGSDCVGKSTLAVRLAKHLEESDVADVRLLHKGPPTAHPLDEYEAPLYDFRPFTGQHVICDRWHWGESVYPAIFGRATRYDDAVRLHVEMFLRSRGAYVIHVTGPNERVAGCIERRGDDLVGREQVRGIDALFNTTAARSVLPKVTVDGHAIIDDVQMFNELIRRAGALARQTKPLRMFTTYIGPPSPKLLLLGDVRGKSMPTCGDPRPAFMPYPATSGHYLLKHMAESLSPRQLAHIGIANACDVDDPHELWRTLGKPHVVALGRHAARTTRTWVEHVVDHPQFRRRFHHRRGAEYVDLIIAGTPIEKMR